MFHMTYISKGVMLTQILHYYAVKGESNLNLIIEKTSWGTQSCPKNNYPSDSGVLHQILHLCKDPCQISVPTEKTIHWLLEIIGDGCE